MRVLFGSLGGVLLALLLFTLLALLVAPPEDNRPVIEMPVSVAMVEAPTPQPPAEAPAQAAPSPPVSTPPPPPAPMPAPSLDSAIAIPTPETPPLEVSKVPLDNQLPELTEIEPEPEPEPEPQPEPPPQPTPEPAQPSPSQAVAQTSEQPSEQAGQAPAGPPAAEVGSPQPTRRVPPEYPARAQRRGLEGYVEVRFTILPDGSVDADSLRVIDAEPRHTFERAAMQAISRWQFSESPGRREARQRLEFRLEG
ncbi:MAG TPA: energy transducer TonB [Modicisalibacter sp.]|nr:energy transducer TonB [Modicisalibacter sp.]